MRPPLPSCAGARETVEPPPRSGADVRSAHVPLAVGRPIKVKQKDHPSTADLEEVQERYIAELKRSVPVLELSPSPRPADLVTDASPCSPAGSGRTTRRCTPRAAPRSSPSLRDARRRRKSTYPRRCSRLVAVVPRPSFRAPFHLLRPLLRTALLACSELCPPSCGRAARGETSCRSCELWRCFS